MKFILVIVWTVTNLTHVDKTFGASSRVVSTNIAHQEVAMQEFDSQVTCEKALEKIKSSAPNVELYCLKK